VWEQYIFSDHTYDKPFFLVYLNTSIFAWSLIPMIISYVRKHGLSGLRSRTVELYHEFRNGGSSPSYKTVEGEDEDTAVGERLLVDDQGSLEALDLPIPEEKLSLRETAWLSLEFCMLWFVANYFASACLEYTSVGSVTILTSTSSVWTLVFCALMKVEGFTVRKLMGVLASLAGVILISSVDLSGSSDDNRGNFPHKSQTQIAIGDGMAFFSAVVYGMYVTVMKRSVGNEDRVDMPLFFGLVGLFNVLFLWPGFFILHFTGIEPFQMPPTGTIWAIVMVCCPFGVLFPLPARTDMVQINSISSFVSDIAWAYAMLLTTPLVVTVGLSLTIPLSLVGEMIQYDQYASWIYWVGAAVVFLSFVFINHESQEEEAPKEQRTESRPQTAESAVV
jgi:solute carrier family 35 protein F5